MKTISAPSPAPHPIEEHLAERFDFLGEFQRKLALFCVKQPFSAHSELIRELVLHIDAECEWQRIEKATPEQIREELRAAGVDCTKSFDRLCDLLARHGMKIRTAAEWRVEHERQYRQLFGGDQ